MSRFTLKLLFVLLFVLVMAGCKGPVQTVEETNSGITTVGTVVPTLNLTWPNAEEAVDSQPILQWEGHPEAAHYNVVVLDDDAYPPLVVIDQVVTEPMLAVAPPLAPGHYSWTVWAQNGDTAVLAELTSTFTVKDVVELVAPAAGEAVSPQPLLQWQAFPGTVSYQVVVIDDAYPPVVVLDQTTTETSLAVTPPLESGSYSWTVWAFDGVNNLLAELTSNFAVPGD